MLVWAALLVVAQNAVATKRILYPPSNLIRFIRVLLSVSSYTRKPGKQTSFREGSDVKSVECATKDLSIDTVYLQLTDTFVVFGYVYDSDSLLCCIDVGSEKSFARME